MENLKETKTSLINQNLQKEEFLSVMVHDLNGAFASNIQLVDLLEKKKLDQDKRELLITKLFEKTKSAYNLLQGLIEWGKVSSGREQFNPRRLQFYKLLNNIKDLYSTQISQKEISFNIICSRELFVFGDPYMIEAILRNLLSNAIKFSKKGGKIIITAIEEDDNRIVVGVKDFGIGMNEQQTNNLFKTDFIQSTPGTNNEKGNGLGL